MTETRPSRVGPAAVLASIRALLDGFKEQVQERLADLGAELRSATERHGKDLADYRAVTERALDDVRLAVADHRDSIDALKEVLSSSTSRLEAAFESLASRVEAVEESLDVALGRNAGDGAPSDTGVAEELRALGAQLEVIRRRLPLRSGQRSAPPS